METDINLDRDLAAFCLKFKMSLCPFFSPLAWSSTNLPMAGVPDRVAVYLKDMIRVNFRFFPRHDFNKLAILNCICKNNWSFNFKRNFVLANFLQNLKNIVATLSLFLWSYFFFWNWQSFLYLINYQVNVHISNYFINILFL